VLQDFCLGIVIEEKVSYSIFHFIEPNENICTWNKEFTYCFIKSNPTQLVFVKLKWVGWILDDTSIIV